MNVASTGKHVAASLESSGLGKQAAATRVVDHPRKARLRWRFVAAGCVVIAASAGWYMLGHGTSASALQYADEPAADGGKATLGFHRFSNAKRGGGSTPMETVRVKKVPRQSRLGLTGTLAADESSHIASNASGIVTQVLVDRGSVAKQGDVLVQLDPTDAQNRLTEGLALVDELKAKLTWEGSTESFSPEDQPAVRLADAALVLATSRLRRAEALVGKNAVTVDEYEQHRTEHDAAVQRRRQAVQEAHQDYYAYQTAVAKLTALKKAVADTTIVAPFDGLVLEKNVAVGEQVMGGMSASPVVTLARVDPIRVCVTVPQQSIGVITASQNVYFYVDSYPGKIFRAVVRYISPAVTSDTRALTVEAVADNADGSLRPGMFVTAELELPQEQPELRVPVTAIKAAGEVAKVLVVRDGVAREQVIALGEEANGWVAVRTGLTGTEELLLHPELFKDGDSVLR